jgi:hypothetical protein
MNRLIHTASSSWPTQATHLTGTDPDPADVVPGGTMKAIDFLTEAQHKELADTACAALKRGAEPHEIEADIKDFLRDLPDGLLARHDWQVDQLAELLTVAAILAAMCVKNRPHHG